MVAQEVESRTAEADRAVPQRRRVPEDLVRTAERLFAANGIDVVSLRQIAVEAGYRNPAAVQYHFGSKAALLRAILEYRLPAVTRRRLELLDKLDREQRDFDVRGLVEVFARPLLELDRDAHYVEFLARLIERPELEDAYQSTGFAQSTLLVHERFHVALGAFPTAVRENRIRMARDLMLNAISNRRARTVAGIEPALPDDLFAQDLFDGMVGLLCADHTELRTRQVIHTAAAQASTRSRMAR